MNTMGKLAGKTIFITGASRGIGKAIALRCAQDGANIIIAAKTADPHPKLPGTIYTAAEEVEKAGGKCLPCVVDIRYEDQVQNAVQQAVSKFGGIDILINNASAISLTPTEATSMKTYDLMNGVNARGTFMCSKVCAPYLRKGNNPHILNISPPLNLNPRWFEGHVAYTMAKYGMSFCVLGMSHEFKNEGIAVNALWPRTGIYTAAMEMLGGGPEVKDQCRSPDIMSDAAYVMLTKDSKSYTGNFAIDDEVLGAEGITDLKKYQYNQDVEPLPDFFLDVEGNEDTSRYELKPAPKKTGKALSTGNTDLDNTFKQIQAHMDAALVSSVKGVFQFDFKDGGRYYLDLKNGDGKLGFGDVDSPDVVMTLKADNFVKMARGEVNPTTAFMSGKLKIDGNLGVAMKLEKVLKGVQSKL